MIAIIGGSGFEKFEKFKVIEELSPETPYGNSSSGFKKIEIDGTEMLFISRHGIHHELLPSEVNYQANIFNLKKHGAKCVVSFSAIGSLRKDLKAGDLVIPHQYIDRTKSIRKHSFSGNGFVAHVSLAKPVCSTLIEYIQNNKSEFDFDVHINKTYICIEGPYFSTQAESIMFRNWGADVIGMTNYPEYALAREAGLAYLPLCFVTDYDCWDDNIPHVTVPEVIEVMRNNNSKAFTLIQHISKNSNFWKNSTAFEQGIKNGLLTPMDAISKENQRILEVLM